MMLLLLLPVALRSLLLFAAIPLAYGEVEFITPTAGAVLPVGPINIAWKDNGRPPVIEELTEYTLQLVVGGNELNNSLRLDTFVSPGYFTNGSTVTADISAEICGPVSNGFYLMISSTTRSGALLDNYSDRFTLTGLNGTVAPNYLNAAKALDGDTAGPKPSGNAPALTSLGPISSSSAPLTSTPTAQTLTVTSVANSASSTHQSNSHDHSHQASLSTGAIAGIIVAVLFIASGVIAFAVMALLRQRRRRRARERAATIDPGMFGADPTPPEWKQTSITSLSELSAEGRVTEMGDGVPPPEMDSTTIRAELDGNPVQRPPPSRSASRASSIYESHTAPLTPIAPSVFEETLSGPIDHLLTPTTPLSRI